MLGQALHFPSFGSFVTVAKWRDRIGQSMCLMHIAGGSLQLLEDDRCSSSTLSSNRGRHEIAALGGAGRRSARNADRPMNQSREAHRSACPLHSP
jgi:hypothetical protein